MTGMAPARKLDPATEAEFFSALEAAGEFLMGKGNVHESLLRLTRLLEREGIPYAIVGAMALNAYGYRRVTEDVDVLLTRDGLERFKAKYLGRGYVEKFAGSRGLRDAQTNVPIDVVLAGDFPGDGKPKTVAFPDPAVEAEAAAGVRLIPLARLIELKIASGMTAPHRLRDLADVIELVRARDLGAELADRLDPMVRERYLELWRAAQAKDAE